MTSDWRRLGLLSLTLALAACSDDASGGAGSGDTDAETEAGSDGDSNGPGGTEGSGPDSGPDSGPGSDSDSDTTPETAGTSEGCEPTTCDDQGFACGEQDDGCGGTLECGTCDLGDCEDGVCVFEPATQFDDEPVTWAVPDGGQRFSGFDALGGDAGASEYSTVGGQEWSTIDLDGDGFVDLVVTAEAVEREGYYWWAQVLGFDNGNPHWDVYLGSPEGFAEEPTRWALPEGGQSFSGFDALSGNAGASEYTTVGGQEWTTTDLNGDGIPDLVITAEAVEREGYYWWAQVLGFDNGNPHWDVHLGSTEGFAAEPTRWTLPEGGQKFSGFDALGGDAGASEYSTVGGQEWTTTDLDGDGILDLVITAEAVEREGYYWWAQVLGLDNGNPHWDVHLGTSEGFAAEATRWALPEGGQKFSGFDALAGNAGASEYSTVGGQEWATTDLNGDRIPDLVITAEAVEREGYYWWAQVLGFDNDNPHWDVYLGTSEGFSDEATRWALPEGGQKFSGFDALGGDAGASEYSTVGGQEWTTTDINGDRIADLIVTAEAVEREGYYWWAQVLGLDNENPHWDIYVGTGEGFSDRAARWSVPEGGQKFSGFDAFGGNAGASEYSTVGGEEWATTDLDGDGRLDLVVTAHAVEREGYYWWAEVFGFGDAPHWRVFMGRP